MPEKTIYISYRPEQSLHIAQPLFNALYEQSFDVFMDIAEGVDPVNLNQIAAREHFLILLTPGAFTNATDKRLELEFEQATRYKNNIVLLFTRDFDLKAELAEGRSLYQRLKKVPSLRIQPKQINEIVRVLSQEHLQQPAGGPRRPTPSADTESVTKKLNKAREYSKQATIRLNTEKMFFQAVVKIRRGDYDGALNDLDLVISDNPNNESAYLQRGRVLRKKNRVTAALKDYEQATRLSPKLVAAHIGRGELLLQTERYQQAFEAFETALSLQSESAPAIAGLALAHDALGHLDDALKCWNWLVDRDTNYADATWAGEVFDWDESIVERAANLLARHP